MILVRYLLHNLSVLKGSNFHADSAAQTFGNGTLNFVLIDGTWSNSAAMFSRLKVIPLSIPFFLCFSFSFLLVTFEGWIEDATNVTGFSKFLHKYYAVYCGPQLKHFLEPKKKKNLNVILLKPLCHL